MTEIICSFSYFVLSKHLLFDKHNFKSTYLSIIFSISKLTVNNLEKAYLQDVYMYIYIHTHISYIYVHTLLNYFYYYSWFPTFVCTHQLLTTLLDDTDVVVYVQHTK